MSQYKYSIDVLKFICAVLVVILHTGGYGILIPITRCAVPCFLIISGYLLYNTTECRIGQERIKRNIKHIIHIICWSTLLFVVVKEVQAIQNGSFYIPTIRQWVFFIIFNENPFSYHLWYLNAYLYVLLIMLLVDRYNLWRYMLYLAPFFLICNIILIIFGTFITSRYDILQLNYKFPICFARNFLLTGFPYFIIGVWLKKNISRFMAISRSVYAVGIILFSLTSIAEKKVLLYIYQDKCPTIDLYISSTFLAVSLFLFVTSFHNIRNQKLQTFLGRGSLYIYVFHPLVIFLMSTVTNKILSPSLSIYYQYVAPIVIIFATVVLIAFLRKIQLIRI